VKKLLIVDDEFIVRMGIRSIIDWEQHGYTVSADASSGREALEKIAACPPDIVLTDLVMEDMDGFELISRCGEEYPDIRFVVLSSYNDFENVRRAMKLGARDYIFKLTAGPEEILRVLDEVSAGREDQDPRKLDLVIRENLPLIKSNLLRKWMNGSVRGHDIVSRFGALAPGVDLSKPYFVLYLRIGDFERRRVAGEFHDEQLIKSSLETIVYDVFNQTKTNQTKIWKAEVFSGEKGDAAVFINVPAGGAGNAEEYPREEFYRIREYCKRYLGFALSGTFSPALEGTEGLPAVLRICADTLRQRTVAAELWPYNSGLRNEIALVMDHVQNHISEKLGVPELAAVAGMSESYFSHLFKKETGVSVVDYVNHVKVERAMEILEDPAVKIADAAAQLGIENGNYFSVIFKRVTGFSPRDYREKFRKQNNRGEKDHDPFQ
jgi:two-component system response regulator YesN